MEKKIEIIFKSTDNLERVEVDSIKVGERKRDSISIVFKEIESTDETNQ